MSNELEGYEPPLEWSERTGIRLYRVENNLPTYTRNGEKVTLTSNPYRGTDDEPFIVKFRLKGKFGDIIDDCSTEVFGNTDSERLQNALVNILGSDEFK